MEPKKWSTSIIEYLERSGIVGSLLPGNALNANDRYQPKRMFVDYIWSGEESADTQITFKIKAPEDRDDFRANINEWIVFTRPAINSWGDKWEDVTINFPGKQPQDSQENIYAVGRFHIRVRVSDMPMDNGRFHRRIELENLRQVGGMLYAVRIYQNNYPKIHEIRLYGIDEDIYYRAGGLIGRVDEKKREMEFKPYAFLPEPIRTPEIGPTLDNAVKNDIIDPQIESLLKARKITNLYKFQADTMAEIRSCLNNKSKSRAILLTAGTAVGKTESFLMPLLEKLVEDKPILGVQGIFIYPMKALEGDQAKRFFEYLAIFNEGRTNPITIGVYDGDTPNNYEKLIEQEKSGELRTPFSECPYCKSKGKEGKILLAIDENNQPIKNPKCSNCHKEFPWLRLRKDAIRDYWPHLLLTVPDMLHRLLSDKLAWMGHAKFGKSVHYCQNCGAYTPSTRRSLAGERQCDCNSKFAPSISLCPSMIVFDECHLLKGLFGSQVAILISRLKQISKNYGHSPLFIGASATIANPENFGSELFGENVQIIKAVEERKSIADPTRYHLFVMPVGISVLNAVGHVLTGCFIADTTDRHPNRILIFSDSKRTVYQLDSSLPEFYTTIPREILPEGKDSAVTRSHTGDLGSQERRRVESAFDRGEIRVLLATQTLEVGVDFDHLQLEIQTGATYSYNDYIQRVGRAGRRGVQALVICILRPHNPLDYYYFEHCRELVQFLPQQLDEVPLRTDNPFLVERHTPAAIQDYLIMKEPGARLMWDPSGAGKLLINQRAEVETYLKKVFIRENSWDKDLIETSIKLGIEKAQGNLLSRSITGSTNERLSGLIDLSIRSTDVNVPIDSDDFELHKKFISISGEIPGEELEEASEQDSDEEEVTEE